MLARSHRTTMRVALVSGLAFAGLAQAAPGERFRILYAERVAFDDGVQRADAAVSARTTRTRFDAYGRRFDLALESNDRLLAAAAAGTTAKAWRGTLAGIPGSWARLTVANGRRYGMVWDGRDLYVIEPASDAAAGFVGPAPATGDATVVYRLSDTLAPAGGAACATRAPGADDAPTGLEAYTQMVGELRAAAATSGGSGGGTPATGSATATKRIQVSVVADFEYVQAVGATGAQDRIVARFNNIDGIFASQVGVQVELAGPARVFQTSVQPFSATDPNALLNEVGNYRQQLVASGATAGGLTHLVTGRNLDGTTVGIAYIGALCSTKYGVSLSEGMSSFGDLVAAHELGHNFGAPHDGETPTTGVNACSTAPQTFLMSPRINGSNQFSSCSLEQMAPQVAKATCLLPATLPPTVDLGVAAPSTSVRALVDRTFALQATVTKAGTAAASNGRLAFTLPAGIVASAAAAVDGGTCTVQAGGVTCSWPTLAAGAGTTVRLDLRGTAAGAYSIVARTSVTSDASPGNDGTTYTATIDPLPDLALDVPAAKVTASLDQPTTLVAGARNPGAAAANGGTVTFDLPSNVQAGGTLPTGCNATGTRIACALGTVPAGQSVTVSVPVRGAAAGDGTVSLTLASPDDAATSNNTGAITMTVAAAASTSSPAPTQSVAPTPAASTSGSGGGGEFGLLELGALGALFGLRRRARRV
jgi:hypothetical protein